MAKLLLLLCAIVATISASFACTCIRDQGFFDMVNRSDLLLQVDVQEVNAVGDPFAGDFLHTAVVLRVFKGCVVTKNEKIIIRSALSSAACGTRLAPGQWLVSATIQMNETLNGQTVIHTSLCDIHRPWNTLTKDEFIILGQIVNDCPPGPCPDLGRLIGDFGDCDMSLGYGMVNMQCRELRGCSTRGREAFATLSDCLDTCNTPKCTDLTAINFGPCEALLGWGLVNDVCAPIAGCDRRGFVLWHSQEECENACVSGRSECPAGVPMVECFADPCSVSKPCPGAVSCRSDYCGGCNAIWTDAKGNRVCNDQPQDVDEEPGTCENLCGRNFGLCKALLGWGVVGGKCQVIGGCPDRLHGLKLHPSKEICEQVCGCALQQEIVVHVNLVLPNTTLTLQ